MTQAAVKIEWTDAEKAILKKRPPITVSQWAEKYRIVTRGPKKGPWANKMTPYMVKPMDTWNDPWVQSIILVWAPQTGKTQAAFNCLGYCIDYDPDPALYVMPDEKVTKRISRRQILPMLKQTPAISKLLSPRSDHTTTLSIQFQNGMDLAMAWATSAAELASESIRYIFFDETSKYPRLASGEADPVYLGEVRTIAYPDTKKKFYHSTPKLENDAIMRAAKDADEMWKYQAKCPYCGQLQVMTFENITWPKDKGWKSIKRKKLARYQCGSCPMDWDDTARNKAVLNGEWCCDHQVDRPSAVAFHLPSWNSRFVSLSDVAGDFLQGKHDLEKHKIFVTQHKAEPWKQIIIKSSEKKILAARCALPPQTVPVDAVALSCGIDVQKRGFWFVVRAWSRNFTSWLIHYGSLATWDDVENLLFETAYPVQDSDETRRIWRAGIDTGGGAKYEDMSMTEETYWWIRKNGIGRGCRVWGCKGASRPLAGKVHMSKPLDKTPSGKPLPGGLQIITLDTDKIKDMVYYRLGQAAENEAAYSAYLHQDTTEAYARQILAEEKQRDKKGVETWVAVRKDNHLLDAEGLAHIVVDPEWPGGGLNLLKPAGVKSTKIIKNTPAASAPGNWLHNTGRPARPAWLNR